MQIESVLYVFKRDHPTTKSPLAMLVAHRKKVLWASVSLCATALLAGNVLATESVSPAAMTFHADPLMVRQTLAVGALQAEESASRLRPDCAGYISASTPDAVIRIPRTHDILSLYVESAVDTTLAVRRPDGQWFCDDDSWLLHPALTFTPAAVGDYEVFVGAYAAGMTGEYTLFGAYGAPVWTPEDASGLTAQEFLSGESLQRDQTPGAGTLHVSGRPEYWQRSIPNIPFASEMEAIPAERIAADCVGFINPSRPDVLVRLDSPADFLSVLTASDQDTTLLIVDPSGAIFCNDDFIGLNAGIEFTAATAGDYSVWIGEFGGQSGVSAITVLVENPAERFTLLDYLMGSSRPDIHPLPETLHADFLAVLQLFAEEWPLDQVSIPSSLTLRHDDLTLELDIAALRIHMPLADAELLLSDVRLILERETDTSRVAVALEMPDTAEILVDREALATLALGQQHWSGLIDAELGEWVDLQIDLRDAVLSFMTDSDSLRLGTLLFTAETRPGVTSPLHRNATMQLEIADLDLKMEGFGALSLDQLSVLQTAQEVDVDLVILIEEWLETQDASRLLESLLHQGQALERLLALIDSGFTEIQVQGLRIFEEYHGESLALDSARLRFDLEDFASEYFRLRLSAAVENLETVGFDLPGAYAYPSSATVQLSIQNIPGPRTWLHALPMLLIDSSYSAKVLLNSGIHLHFTGDSADASGTTHLGLQWAADPHSPFGVTLEFLLEQQDQTWFTELRSQLENILAQELPPWMAQQLLKELKEQRIFIGLDSQGTMTLSSGALQILLALLLQSSRY